VLTTSSSEVHSLEDAWAKYKSALDSAAREVLGPRLSAKKPRVSQATLSIIDQWRKAIQRGDTEEYRRLAALCWISLRHDKNQWAEQLHVQARTIFFVARSRMHLPTSDN